MKCPVCHSNCREDWETCGVPEAEDGRRASWWAGQYECRQCGTFTASGTRQGGQGGEMLMHVWHPVCPLHGHTCLRLAEGRYTCGMLRCRLQWNVRGKRLVVSKIGELAREAAEGGALSCVSDLHGISWSMAVMDAH